MGKGLVAQKRAPVSLRTNNEAPATTESFTTLKGREEVEEGGMEQEKMRGRKHGRQGR